MEYFFPSRMKTVVTMTMTYLHSSKGWAWQVVPHVTCCFEFIVPCRRSLLEQIESPCYIYSKQLPIVTNRWSVAVTSCQPSEPRVMRSMSKVTRNMASARSVEFFVPGCSWVMKWVIGKPGKDDLVAWYPTFNSLAPVRCRNNFPSVFFKCILWIDILNTSCEIGSRSRGGHSVRFHTGVCSSGVRTLTLF